MDEFSLAEALAMIQDDCADDDRIIIHRHIKGANYQHVIDDEACWCEPVIKSAAEILDVAEIEALGVGVIGRLTNH